VTALLFRDDAYAKSCPVTVTGVNERGGILLDQTVFYATAGGQPGDKGTLTVNGRDIAIATTIYDENKTSCMFPPKARRTCRGRHGHADPRLGQPPPHHARPHHDAPALRRRALPGHGIAITDDGGRIDFDIPEGQIPIARRLADKINGWISEDHP
jgi:misacylated tRNA(Ala) deacylase